MGAPALLVVVVVNCDPHLLGSHLAEQLPLEGFGVDVRPHLLGGRVPYLQFLLGDLVRNQEKKFLMCLLFLPADIRPFLASRMVDLLSW